MIKVVDCWIITCFQCQLSLPRELNLLIENEEYWKWKSLTGFKDWTTKYESNLQYTVRRSTDGRALDRGTGGSEFKSSHQCFNAYNVDCCMNFNNPNRLGVDF